MTILESLTALVRSDEPHLTSRQLAVLLTVNLSIATEVRTLAAHLGLSKPAITRALDRLVADGLVRRQPRKTDRRLVFVVMTGRGSRYAAGLHRGDMRTERPAARAQAMGAAA